MNKAVCYVRVSTEEQAREGISLDAQQSALGLYCQATGLDIVQLLREEGVSAHKPLIDRPCGRELLKLIKTKAVSHVVIYKLDRMFRNVHDCTGYIEAWDKSGISLHIKEFGGQAIDTRSAIGKAFLQMMVVMAEFERNVTSERTIRALSFNKERRQVYSYITPYGYDRCGDDLIANANELATVGLMKEWHQGGRSYCAIARDLAAMNVPTKTGGQWHPQIVKQILRNDLYQ